MFVPAMAFAWWLVAMPVRSPAAAAPAALRVDDSADTEAALEPNADVQDEHKTREEPVPIEPTEGPSEDRVKLRGPVTPEIVRLAQQFLDLPMGAKRTFEMAGRRLVFVLEWHYHPPEHVGGPKGWHKGVTVYEQK